jgi:hypothetical protein
MTALTRGRMLVHHTFTSRKFTLAASNAAYKGGIACIDLSTGKVEPGHVESDLLYIGTFNESKASSVSDQQVEVHLGREVTAYWFVNGSSITAASVGSLCYIDDDQTVSTTAAGKPVAGRIWDVSATEGVLVEKLTPVTAPGIIDFDPGAFVAADLVIADNPVSGSTIELPATAANSTVTLPAAAKEGTILYFVANGTLNGHTVQYRDATGPANLTTALTASKKHAVVAIFLNAAWRANAYVSP